MEQLNKVHLVPTDKYSELFYNFNVDCEKPWGGLFYTKGQEKFGGGYKSAKGHISPRHIYFTSDEEIKEGDEVITPRNNIGKVAFVRNNFIVVEGYGSFNIGSCRKITATTNLELWYDFSNKGLDENHRALANCNRCGLKGVFIDNHSCNIVKIPQSFVDDYIKAYNEGKRIEQVLLKLMCFNNANGKEIEDDGYIDNFTNGKLKLNSAGEVEWKLKEEKMYTREELREATFQTLKSCYGIFLMKGGCEEELRKYHDERFNKNYPDK